MSRVTTESYSITQMQRILFYNWIDADYWNLNHLSKKCIELLVTKLSTEFLSLDYEPTIKKCKIYLWENAGGIKMDDI